MTPAGAAPVAHRPARRSGASETEKEQDLVFVGAGASTAYTLVGLLDALVAEPGAREALRICVIDRAPDAFSGLPYGSRAARSCLLITSLDDFLPDDERRRFSRWLSQNKHWVFGELHASAGPFGQAWWRRHGEAVGRDDFDRLFLPRYVFGEYLKHMTHEAIADAEAAGRAQVTVLRDEVESVCPSGRGYEVVAAGRVVRTHRVVLAVGSPPALPRLRDGSEGAGAVLLDDPFDDLPGALELVSSRLAETALLEPPALRATHIVIVGGNASAMDVLTQVYDLTGPGAETADVTVLSPRGELPALNEGHLDLSGFRPEELEVLSRSEALRAADVYSAAVRDIERGRESGLTPAHTLGPVSQAVTGLLPRLSSEELAEFAGRWGAQLGRHQRRAGPEYWEVVERLTAEGRFRLVRGFLTGVVVDPDGSTHVEYAAPGGPARLDRSADVVVNCAGPGGDLRVAAPGLLGQLLRGRTCTPSHSGAGIAVGAGLRAAEGLYVMGPLLAGNLVDGRPVWHLEHCGRISVYGTELGRRLARGLGGASEGVI